MVEIKLGCQDSIRTNVSQFRLGTQEKRTAQGNETRDCYSEPVFYRPFMPILAFRVMVMAMGMR